MSTRGAARQLPPLTALLGAFGFAREEVPSTAGEQVSVLATFDSSPGAGTRIQVEVPG